MMQDKLELDKSFLWAFKQLDYPAFYITPNATIVALTNAAAALFNATKECIINQPLQLLFDQCGLEILLTAISTPLVNIKDQATFIKTPSNKKILDLDWQLYQSTDHAGNQIGAIIYSKQISSLEQLAHLHQIVTGQKKLTGGSVGEYAGSIIKYYESIIAAMPGNVFWVDKNEICLGCNDNVIKFAGLKKDQIVGKSYTEAEKFAPWLKEFTPTWIRDDQEVIATGKPKINIEEPPVQLPDGKAVFYLTNRVPLFDADNRVIGVLGLSFDITDRKRAEELKIAKEIAEKEIEKLRLENELQKTQLELQEQEKFTKLADQVVHDIRSPLASLLMIVKSCKDIPEQERIALREAAASIDDIANNLLGRYKKSEAVSASANISKREPLLVSLLLLNLVTDKKYQYQNTHINLNYAFNSSSAFAFISAELTSFKRMLSNLIDNSVDAIEGRPGQIEINLEIGDEVVKITIKDNGKGMPAGIMAKIKQNIAITAGKQEGYGIGMTQVHDALQLNEGEIAIASELGWGTTIALTFPRVAAAVWIAEQIKCNAGDTIVILDDDASIHGAWQTRFKSYLNSIRLQHFQLGREVVEYISAAADKNKILLLADFELLQQELNGIEIIKQTGCERAILVTSHYANKKVRGLAASINVKILPKQLAAEVPIVLADALPINIQAKKVDLVILDDDQLFADSLALLFSDKAVDVYYNPVRLLEKFTQYPKDTKFCIDNSLSQRINGIEVAKGCGSSTMYFKQ